MQELIQDIKFTRDKRDNLNVLESIASITDTETNIVIDVKVYHPKKSRQISTIAVFKTLWL